MCKKELDEKKPVQEVNLDDLEQVSGGGVFDNIPRVKNHEIDDDLKSKI